MYDHDESIRACEVEITRLEAEYTAACAERQTAEKRARQLKKEIDTAKEEMALHLRGKLEKMQAQLVAAEAPKKGKK